MGSLAMSIDATNMGKNNGQRKKDCGGSSGSVEGFRMPLHYPRYRRADYEAMPEWKLDLLLMDYGLPVAGDLAEKRQFAMEAFLWS